MPILIVGPERNFAALRPRLFSGRVSSQTAKRVADALRAANPHVDLDALVPGTVLTVPDLPEISTGAELSFDEMATAAVDLVFADAADFLKRLVESAAVQLRDEAAERKRLLKAVETSEVRSAVSDDEALAADLEAIRGEVLAEEQSTVDHAARLKNAHAEWANGLDTLRSMLP